MLQSSVLGQLGRVVHGFGTRDDDMAELFPRYWPDRPVQHERHGTRIAVVDRPNEDCGEADGMFTDRPGLLLCIATADCVPILLARTDGAQVAALHDSGFAFHSCRRDRETRTPVADVQWSVIGLAKP